MREHKVHYGMFVCQSYACTLLFLNILVCIVGQGSDNVYDDAFWLIFGTLKLPLNVPSPEVYFDATLTPSEIKKGTHHSIVIGILNILIKVAYNSNECHTGSREIQNSNRIYHKCCSTMQHGISYRPTSDHTSIMYVPSYNFF